MHIGLRVQPTRRSRYDQRIDRVMLLSAPATNERKSGCVGKASAWKDAGCCSSTALLVQQYFGFLQGPRSTRSWRTHLNQTLCSCSGSTPRCHGAEDHARPGFLRHALWAIWAPRSLATSLALRAGSTTTIALAHSWLRHEPLLGGVVGPCCLLSKTEIVTSTRLGLDAATRTPRP